MGEVDPLAVQLRQDRDERHSREGPEREGPSHALHRQDVEGQVDDEEDQAEAPATDIGKQQREAGA